MFTISKQSYKCTYHSNSYKIIAGYMIKKIKMQLILRYVY